MGQKTGWEEAEPGNLNHIKEEKLVVIKISARKEGLNWDALPHKLKQVKGWVENWNTINSTVSLKWDDGGSVVIVEVSSPSIPATESLDQGNGEGRMKEVSDP